MPLLLKMLLRCALLRLDVLCVVLVNLGHQPSDETINAATSAVVLVRRRLVPLLMGQDEAVGAAPVVLRRGVGSEASRPGGTEAQVSKQQPAAISKLYEYSLVDQLVKRTRTQTARGVTF